jgi:hypothetical protein
MSLPITFPLQKRLHERASAVRYTNIAYPINLQEQCVLYIGQAYRYPPDVAFYVFFQQL